MATSDVSLEDYVRAIERMLDRLAARVAASDLDGLRQLVALRDRLDFDRLIEAAVAGLLADEDYPAKLSDIADVLGVSVPQASKKFRHLPRRRRQGGQPGEWR